VYIGFVASADGISRSLSTCWGERNAGRRGAMAAALIIF